MKHARTLSIAAALAMGLISMDAFAATPHIDASTTQPAQLKPGATYYIADAGTKHAHKVYFFKQLDRNHDGYLERSELPGEMHMLRARFIYADWNHDGRLSPAEVYMWDHHTGPLYVGISHAMVVYVAHGSR